MQTAFSRKMMLVLVMALLLVWYASANVSDYYCRRHVLSLFSQGFRSAALSLDVMRRRLSNSDSIHSRSIDQDLQLLLNVYSMTKGQVDQQELNFLRQSMDARLIAVTSAKGQVLACSDNLLLGSQLPEQPLSFEAKEVYQSFLSNTTGSCEFSQMVSTEGEPLVVVSLRGLPSCGGMRLPLIAKVAYSVAGVVHNYEQVERDTIGQALYIGESGGLDIIDNGIVVHSNEARCLGLIGAAIYGGRLPPERSLTSVERIGVPCQALRNSIAGLTLVAYMPDSEVFAVRNITLTALGCAAAFLFLVLHLIVAYLVKTTIVDGIEKINLSLSIIGEGHLDETVEVHSYPEFSALSRGINSTVRALRRLMSRDSQRVAEQLELARAIQLSCLPAHFPVNPEVSALDVCAMTEPAQEVGGDFYDFFRISSARFGFVIADVTDHGIPAALFMMTAKTMLHEVISGSRSLAQDLEAVNLALCSSNNTDMFVTAFVGIIDIEKKTLTCVNCGHNPPLICRQGQWRPLKCKGGFVLAAMESTTYSETVIPLIDGDRLLLYTDGVTDLSNFTSQMLGLKQFQKALNATVARNFKAFALIKHIRQYLEVYRENIPASDDITVMVVDFLGDLGRDCVRSFRGSEEELANVQAFLESLMEKVEPIPPNWKRLHSELMIIVEEVFLNIVHHGQLPHDSLVYVRAEIDNSPRRLIIHFVDEGRPFDPLAQEAPDVSAAVGDRSVGGLGIMLTQRLADDISYRHEDGHNILRIVKKLGWASAPTSLNP